MKYANLITLKELLQLTCIENFIVMNGNKKVFDFMTTDYIIENINTIPSLKIDDNNKRYRLSFNTESLVMTATIVITVREVTNEVREND